MLNVKSDFECLNLSIDGFVSSNSLSASFYYGDGSNLQNITGDYINGSTGINGSPGPTGSVGYFSYAKGFTSFAVIGRDTNSRLLTVFGNTGTNNRILGYAIYLRSDITFDAVRWRIETPGSGEMIFGLYKIEDGEPKTLVWDSGTQSLSLSGTITLEIEETNIEQGLYLVSYISNANAVFQVNDNLLSLFGEGTGGQGQPTYNSSSYQYNGSLPNTFPIGWVVSTIFLPKFQFNII